MPIKRRAAKVKEYRITPEAASAFVEAQRGRERYIGCIQGEGCQSTSASEHCVECRAHLDASARLHRALGLPLYMPSPLHVSPEHPCPWPKGSGGARSWPLALELRAELEKGEAT